MVVNPVTINNHVFPFNCSGSGAVRALDSMAASFISGLGLDALSLAWPHIVQLVVFFHSGSQ